MIHEHEPVVLCCDVPEHGLARGDIGTVVLVHPEGGYEVEFMTLDGATLAVVSVVPTQVRAIGRGEIAHARTLKPA